MTLSSTEASSFMANSEVYDYKKFYTTYSKGEERREPAKSNERSARRMKGRGKLKKPLQNNVFKMASSSLIMDEEILNSIFVVNEQTTS